MTSTVKLFVPDEKDEKIESKKKKSVVKK